MRPLKGERGSENFLILGRLKAGRDLRLRYGLSEYIAADLGGLLQKWEKFIIPPIQKQCFSRFGGFTTKMRELQNLITKEAIFQQIWGVNYKNERTLTFHYHRSNISADLRGLLQKWEKYKFLLLQKQYFGRFEGWVTTKMRELQNSLQQKLKMQQIWGANNRNYRISTFLY